MDYTYLELAFFALCLWREAQNQTDAAITGVAWTIRNRVKAKLWFGVSYVGVVTHPYQYSSFNSNDPNSRKYPTSQDKAFIRCMKIAQAVFSATAEEGAGTTDPTNGAVSYFDKSLDKDPPKWALDTVQFKHTVDIGDFHFYKLC